MKLQSGRTSQVKPKDFFTGPDEKESLKNSIQTG